MSEYVIETWGLTKQYDGKAGCRNISLRVPEGVVFGFLGPNGAGKSTFVRTLLGLLKPTFGKAEILGTPISTLDSRKQVGYLPELFRYPDWLTGRQLLNVHANLCGVEKGEKQKRIDYLLERVGLQGRGEEKIRGYSKGMQQRIGLACALVSAPKILFLDEPTSALDPIGRREVRELINDLRNEGTTIFLNSHLLSEVESVCDHVGIIHKGELVVQGEWRKLSAVRTQVEVAMTSVPDNFHSILPTFVLHVERKQPIAGRQHWLLTLEDDENIPYLVSHLLSVGVYVYQVTPKQQNLEDVFLYWLKRKEQEWHVDNRQVIN